MDIIIIKPIGGSRGNSSKGINFGSVGNPEPPIIALPSGRTIKTDVHYRHASLVSYAVNQAYVENVSVADIFHLFFHLRFEVHTNVDLTEPDWVKDSKGNTIIPNTRGKSIWFDDQAFFFDSFKGEWRLSFFPYLQERLGLDPCKILFVGLDNKPSFYNMVYGEEGRDFRVSYLKSKGYKNIYIHQNYPDNLEGKTLEEIWGSPVKNKR